MITAEELRNELGINNNMSIKNILINYFDEVIENYKNKKDSIYSRIQYGIIDVKVEKILNKYGITSELIDSKVLKDELTEFVKYIKSLGYTIKCKRVSIDDFLISISWLNNFKSEETNLVPDFMINKDKDIEFSKIEQNVENEEEKEEKKNK